MTIEKGQTTSVLKKQRIFNLMCVRFSGTVSPNIKSLSQETKCFHIISYHSRFSGIVKLSYHCPKNWNGIMLYHIVIVKYWTAALWIEIVSYCTIAESVVSLNTKNDMVSYYIISFHIQWSRQISSHCPKNRKHIVRYRIVADSVVLSNIKLLP